MLTHPWNPTGHLLVELSLWSADPLALKADLDRLGPHVDALHVDVADTRFVDELIFSPHLVQALVHATDLPVHVHLMARNAPHWADRFCRAGAHLVTVHAEADRVAEALTTIRGHGRAAGLALRLDTPLAAILPHLDQVDVITMIGTPLGTKGTHSSPKAVERLHAVREMLRDHQCGGRIRVVADGGIREHTVPDLATAGAHAVVAGSLLCAAQDPDITARWMHRHQPGREIQPVSP